MAAVLHNHGGRCLAQEEGGGSGGSGGSPRVDRLPPGPRPRREREREGCVGLRLVAFMMENVEQYAQLVAKKMDVWVPPFARVVPPRCLSNLGCVELQR